MSRCPSRTGDGGDSPAWSRKRGAYEPVGERRGSGSSVPYAELHAHSAYSFLDGASTPEELVEEAARLDLRAIALTDHDGLYGVVRFAEAAKELDVRDGVRRRTVAGQQRRAPRTPIRRGRICWCWPAGRRGTDGCPGRSRAAHLAGGEKGKPRYDYDALTEAAGGHWHILTGCRKGHVRQALSTGGPEAAEAALADLVDRFGRRPGQCRADPSRPPARRRAQRRAGRAGATLRASGVVATTAAHFAEPSRGRLAMAMGAIRARNSMDEAAGWLAPLGGSHLRSGEEMAQAVLALSRGGDGRGRSR